MVVNTIHATYQEVYDIKTNSGKVSVLGIHTPSGAVPSTLLSGFYEMYNKVRYNGCSMQLVPSARLPVDPLQISIDPTEGTVDPRDVLNPLLFRGCHGESINQILDEVLSAYGSSPIGDSVQSSEFNLEQLESMYYQALTDDAFLKSSISSPFRKDRMYPLVYGVATNYQLNRGLGQADLQFPGSVNSGQAPSSGTMNPGVQYVETDEDTFYPSTRDQQWFSAQLHRLDWLDTHNRVGNSDGTPPIATIPKVFMGLLVLPPAYKTIQYFRMILTHSFSFRDFRPKSLQGNYDDVPGYYNSMETVNATANVASVGVR